MNNKDDLKNSLSIDDIFQIVASLGGQPHQNGDCLYCKTICHNGDSHKLYYYDNTKLFKCYTQCPQDSFDIFDLVKKTHRLKGEKEYGLANAIHEVAIFFGRSFLSNNFFENGKTLKDWEIFQRYEQLKTQSSNKIIELKEFDDSILTRLPRVVFDNWAREGISDQAIANANICYDPVNHGIVIPHYDINGKLIGIRERTLIEEQQQYGKYRPAIINRTQYNHPLSFNLYNINNSKDNINKMRIAIVFEGQKSPLLYQSYFGIKNDISVACCGSNLIRYQFDLLRQIGADEIVIAFDKQFQEIGDAEYLRWTKKLRSLYEKYGGICKISFIFDNQNILQYKSSPIDEGKDKFLYMFKRRITW